MERKSGILLPVSSLPSRYGIGCFSREAYEFVDYLVRAGQTYWQILPLGQTGYGDSPYQSFSTFAGNPYFIDPEKLIQLEYISREEADAADCSGDPARVSYADLYDRRHLLLAKAYRNSPFALQLKDRWKSHDYDREREDFNRFIQENIDWLQDYALYWAVKQEMGGIPFIKWERGIRLREPEAVAKWTGRLSEHIRFIQFQQYMFFSQWTELKKYANEKGIRIIGDLPIYVAFDSADAWSHPELFEFDEDGYPTVVAGCPPDAFSETGQLWGNPIYRWDYHKETGYSWWMDRLGHAFRLYDMVRIDHFRGFDEYYTITSGSQTAIGGQWKPGPGIDLFRVMKERLGDRDIIAEDLGYLTPSVHRLLEDSGYPGMKVLQFAFSGDPANLYLPHNHVENSVVYTGTHDNQTTAGWYQSAPKYERAFIHKYLGIFGRDATPGDMIRTALMSVAALAVIPMQDYLELGNEARINTPSTMGSNWQWRLVPGQLTDQLADRIRDLTELYQRI